ncbi:MAG TPA: hypothetical protein VMM76_07975, partial [Pirellulaceae bacterium]|nr:hypothetical protein [Pirellulaceae bacterium]
SEWEARIEAALNAKGEWEFEDVPLKDVCEAIQEKLGFDIVLDGKALDEFGVDTETPIWRSMRGISNRSFLRLMLSELELTYTMRLGALWITTPEYAESRLTTKVYPVSDLMEQDPDSGERVVDYDSLEQAMMSVIEPDAWDEVGGPGAIEGIYGSLVISQTDDVHEEVSRFLRTYRAIVENERDADVPQPTAFILGQKGNELIRAALDKPLTAVFEDVPLHEAIEFIVEAKNIPIVIDTRALEGFGIDTSTPINAKFKETPLRFALARVLHELELVYTIRDEVLVITTPEEEEAQLLIGLYPVRDLVQIAGAPLDDLSGTYADFDSLINVFTSTIAPDTWDEVGGPGAIEPLQRAPTLVISQTQAIHEQISALLTTLREAKKQAAVGHGDVDPDAHIVRSYTVNASQCSSDEIAKLVIRASEPGTWNEEAGTFVQGLGTSVVVKHNASIHRRVQKLLFDIGLYYYGGKFGGGGQGLGGGMGGGGFGGGTAGGASGSTNAPENPPTPNPAPGGYF